MEYELFRDRFGKRDRTSCRIQYNSDMRSSRRRASSLREAKIQREGAKRAAKITDGMELSADPGQEEIEKPTLAA
jgi:hypothetical protein